MLPELPKQNKSTEADFGLTFRKWIRANPPKVMGEVYELKHTRGEDYLAFDAVEPEQVAYGGKIEARGELVRVMGSRGEPDYIWVHGPSWIVVKYPTFWCMIRRDKWLWERNMGKRKSLTSARAREIADVVV